MATNMDNLNIEIDRITDAVQARGYRLDIPGGALPGETALVIDPTTGDAVDDPEEPLAAMAQLYAILVDLREGTIEEKDVETFGGNVCRRIIQEHAV
ncbi:hypothetical protein [Burkholderia vietnamiensis]|uniref:hypothetical protein n=1 Tax=Burkholderia vietnamiensis TaxID=60552 RepID=UPI001CF4B981|nr:hypothetical protein [Burkholderia vietnamiensis]MCA8448878.1 hypothetical protein [Burkholderia vietnamiensis]